VHRQHRSLVFAFLATLVWFAFVTVWAIGSQVDIVPTGFDNAATPPGLSSSVVKCSRILSVRARSKTPLPALATQPPGKAPLAFQHAPCSATHRQGQILFAANVAVLVGIIGILIFLWRRRTANARELAAL
jgi:hypothetical protein